VFGLLFVLMENSDYKLLLLLLMVLFVLIVLNKPEKFP